MNNHSSESYLLALLLTAFAIWCWLGMMFTHELGHVLAAWLTGGRIVHVNVYPGRIPSTLVRPNPWPSVVLWSGFLAGWLAPQAIAWVARGSRRLAPVTACWAGFCWLAGGAYLAAGGFERLTDTGQLMKAGWPLWLLVVVGGAATTFGYWEFRNAARAFLSGLINRSLGPWPVACAWLGLGLWISLQWFLAVVLEQAAGHT